MPSFQALQKRSQGNVEPLELVEGPDAWYADEYRTRTDWIHKLTETDIAELDSAIARAQSMGIGPDNIQTLTREDFHLPTLGPKLEDIREEVRAGRGFALIQGIPVDRYSRLEVMIAYWGIGLFWGKAVSNNKKGHLIGHIKDIGHDPKNPLTRLYATHAAQPYHNDASDLVSLLCLKNAKEGGMSSWSSSITVHNELVKKFPHLVEVLAGPWYFDRKGEVPTGKAPYFMVPVFNYYQGYLSVNYSDNYYHLSQRHPEVPRFTADHLEAMMRFNELASSDALRMDHYLQPGEIQLLSNHTCLHTRQAFVDYEDPNEKRHLLRLWLSPPNDRPLPDCYAELLGGSTTIGNRGGIRVEGYEECIRLEAE